MPDNHKETNVIKIKDLKTIQKLCYEILCDIDDYCKKNNIIYFLSGGSCLGAVRHQGYVPWDDDIDIMLPRKDYERLISGFSKEFNEKYSVGALKTNLKWARPYGRIWRNDTRLKHVGFNEIPMGIFVDVFPIDGLPDNALRRWIHYKYAMFLHLCRNSALHVKFGEYERAKIFKTILSPVCKKIGARKFAIHFDKIIRQYDFDTCSLVGAVSAAHYWDHETMGKEVFKSAIYIQFVDRKFPVPVGYDEYLTSLYGNYMEMPSDEKIKATEHRINWEVELFTSNTTNDQG